MAFDICLTEPFKDDLFEAFDFLSKSLNQPHAAMQLMERVEKSKEALSEFPQMAPVSRKPHLHERGYREYFFDSYSLVYKVVNDEVLFLRLLHQSQRAEGQMVDWEE